MRTWLVILMGYEILHTLQSTCSDRPKIVCAPVGGRVSVPCPNPSADQVKFSLFKDGEPIRHRTCNPGINTRTVQPNTTTVGVDSKQAENNCINFTLTVVNASSHGIYTCEGIVMFPPPLKNLPSTPGILLLVEGHYCNDCMNKTSEVNQSSGPGWLWIFIAALILGSYSVAVTIVAIIIWGKWKKEDSQSPYVNTNPTTARRNKGRLHNPKPRFFYAPN